MAKKRKLKGTNPASPSAKTPASLTESSSLRRVGKIASLLCVATLTGVMGAIVYDFGVVAVTGVKADVNLKQRAYNTYVSTKNTYARRGTIYDTTGGILAEEVKSYTLTANLTSKYGQAYVEDPAPAARKLSTVLSLSELEIYEILSAENRAQVEFGTAGRSLTYLEKKAIEELEIEGISFTENSKRYYPMNTYASYTLGYAIYDAEIERITGHLGLELYYDELLAGQNGLAEYLRDRKGYQLPNTQSVILEEAKEGMDIYTTIDPTIQGLLEEAFTEVESVYAPESLVGIVADAKTGAILGMTSRETFDPNVRDLTSYYDPLVSTAFEPGSTMKIYTYAAAINEGVYPYGGYFESGNISHGGLTIKDWKPQGWGWISYDQGFYISSNVGIINLMADYLDTDVYLSYLDAFGFGKQTGITLPNEASGYVTNGSDYTQVLTSAFGQGIMTTPIQHIQALTSIVNGGEMLKPYLVEKFYDPNTESFIEEGSRTVVGQPITAETAAKMKSLMYGVVYDEKMGSGLVYGQMDDVTTGGKTGTAQIPKTDGGGYVSGGSNDYVFSFAGFAPYEDPQYIIYLAIQQPQSGAMGGHGILSSVYRYVLEQALGTSQDVVFEVLETTDSSAMPVQELVEVERYLNLDSESAIALAKEQGLAPILLGSDGTIESQSPSRAAVVLNGSRLLLKTQGNISLPDFTKWTADEVSHLEALTGRQVSLEGTGFVYRQSLAAGSVWEADEMLTLYLSLTPEQDKAIWEAEQLAEEKRRAEEEAAEAAAKAEAEQEDSELSTSEDNSSDESAE